MSGDDPHELRRIFSRESIAQLWFRQDAGRGLDLLTLFAERHGVTRAYARRLLRGLGASDEWLRAAARKPERGPTN